MASQYLITGNDEFSIKNKAKELVVSLCGTNYEDNPDLEIVQGDKDDAKPEIILQELLGSLQTPPFLSGQKIVWMKNFQYFDLAKGSSKSAKGKPAFDELTNLLKDGMPDDITFIINGIDLVKTSSFFKTFKKVGNVEIFEKADLSSKDFSKNQRYRIMDFVKQSGKTIANDAVEYLIATIGSDSGRLKSELDKLFCYVGETPQISLEDCKKISSKTPEALSWDFANALTDKNLEKALETVNVLMEQMKTEKGSSNSELSLLFAAIRNFQDMIKVKKAAAELGVPSRCNPNYFSSLPAGLKEKYPNNTLLSCHPYRAFMMVKGASRFTQQELVTTINALLTTNKQLVSGGCQPRIALEQLLLKVCRRR